MSVDCRPFQLVSRNTIVSLFRVIYYTFREGVQRLRYIFDMCYSTKCSFQVQDCTFIFSVQLTNVRVTPIV